MAAEKHQPFGPSFARDVEAILAAAERHPLMFTDAEIRASLEKAGMIVHHDIPMPDFTPPTVHYEEDDYAEPDE